MRTIFCEKLQSFFFSPARERFMRRIFVSVYGVPLIDRFSYLRLPSVQKSSLQESAMNARNSSSACIRWYGSARGKNIKFARDNTGLTKIFFSFFR